MSPPADLEKGYGMATDSTYSGEISVQHTVKKNNSTRITLKRNSIKEAGFKNIVVYEEIESDMIPAEEIATTPTQAIAMASTEAIAMTPTEEAIAMTPTEAIAMGLNDNKETVREKKKKKKKRKCEPLTLGDADTDQLLGPVEVGTAESRAGVPRKRFSTPPAALEARYAYPEDMDLLIRSLIENIKENNKMFKYLDELETEVLPTSKRNDKVQVEVRLSVMKVIEVDTKKQNFTAEIFLQAKWSEPRLAGKGQQELDNIDWSVWWTPQISLSNIEGLPDEDQSWNMVHSMEPGYRSPVVYCRRRIRAKFNEHLELRDFPVDIQELTVQVSSTRCNSEVELIEDKKIPSKVESDNFNEAQSWKLYRHVQVWNNVKTNDLTKIYETKNSNPIMHFTCHVARNSMFFLINILLFMFLLTTLSFCAYSVNARFPEGRLAVTLTLLLISVTFKLVVNTQLPVISYVTSLDVYVVAGIIFLSLQAVQHAIAGACANGENPDIAENVDEWSSVVMVILTVLFHVCFIVFLAVRAYQGRSYLSKKGEEYERRCIEKYQFTEQFDCTAPLPNGTPARKPARRGKGDEEWKPIISDHS